MNALVKFSEPRLPYHTAIQDRFGVDKSGWKTLTEAIFPSARSVDAIVMALAYCKQRQLDIFKRPVHIVPIWDSKKREFVETVWPGISELRTTAFRTGQYAGISEVEFGPTIEQTFEGQNSKGDRRKATVRFPEWCRMTILRVLNGQERKFVSPTVYWVESYGRWSGTDVPNDMWCRRPVGQLEKCTEAGGLRRAFSEEIGNEYTAEEMEGQRMVTAAPTPPRPPVPPIPPAQKQIPAPAPMPPPLEEPKSEGGSEASCKSSLLPEEYAHAVRTYRNAVMEARTAEDLDVLWGTYISPIEDHLPPELYEEAAGADTMRREMLS